MTRALALDHGERRCGVALSDPSGTIATPLEVIKDPDTEESIKAISSICHEKSVEHVVVGLPLTLSGEESQQTKSARVFADRLREVLPSEVSVELVDERLTTSQARGLGGTSELDSRAAAVLLERWLASGEGGF